MCRPIDQDAGLLPMRPCYVCKRELGISHTEFYRLIAKTVVAPDRLVLRGQSSVLLAIAGGTLMISLQAERHYWLGALSLPRTALQFHFYSLGAQAIEDYFDRFARVFQRGGG